MKKYFNLLKKITGTQYFCFIIIVSIVKFLLGYYIPIIKNIGFLDLLLINFFGCILFVLNWFRTRRFIEWKYYFFLLTIFGLIHSIGFTFFDTSDLLNSKFYFLIKLSTLGTFLITIIITILNSNK